MLVEGSSRRSTSRVIGVSRQTVTRLLVEAGTVAWRFHDEIVRGVRAGDVQCDEIWSYCYCKRLNAPFIKGDPGWAGDVWTWTAIDSETKLIISFAVGNRSRWAATMFMGDLAGRLATLRQLTTDGYAPYLDAVPAAFGTDIDYAILTKAFHGSEIDEDKRKYSPGPIKGLRKLTVFGSPELDRVSTSYVERSNLTLRMSVRRFTRLTNAFSKKVQNHWYSVALYTTWYNFCRPHGSLGTLVTPAMAAGLADRTFDISMILDRIEERELAAVRFRGPYLKRADGQAPRGRPR